MKLRHPFWIRLAAFLASWIVRAWLSTIRYKAVYSAGVPHVFDPREKRFICTVWHESLMAALLIKTKIHVLISHHADGELIAQMCEFLGYGTVRGSTKRGGAKAVEDMTEVAQSRHILVTPDGPRGPRRCFQSGAVYLASRTGLPLVLIGIGFSHVWRARSWDRFAVPLPWSTIYGVVSEPIPIPADLSKARRIAYRTYVEEMFVGLTAKAEGWAAGGPRPTARADDRVSHRPTRSAA